MGKLASRNAFASLLLLALPLWSAQAGAAAERVHRVAIDREYAAYEFIDAVGAVRGFAPSLLQAMAKGAGLRSAFLPTAWPELGLRREQWLERTLPAPGWLEHHRGLLIVLAGVFGAALVLVLWWNLRLRKMMLQKIRDLRVSEQRYRTVFDSSPDAIVIHDGAGRILDANAAAVQGYGYSHDEMLALTLRDFAAADTKDAVPERLRHVAEARSNFQWRHRRRDGSEFPVELSSAPLMLGVQPCFLASARDVTERKREEQLLRLEHAISRCLGETDDVPLALKTVMRLVCEANRSGAGTYWRVDEAAGVLRFDEFWNAPEDGLELYTEGSRAAVFAPGTGLVGRVWQSGAPIWVADFGADPRVVQKALAHQLGMHSAFMFPIVSQGRTLGVMGFLSRTVREPDERLLAVTRVIGNEVGQFLRRKQAEEQVRGLNAELEQRVVARTRELELANHELEAFSYSVSHDLRAPLRTINGFSHLLQEQYAGMLDEQGRGLFRRVTDSAEGMGRLIDDLLDLSRLSRQEMLRAPIDLSAMAREVAEALQAAEPERWVEWVIAPQVTAEGDVGLLRIALQNLLANAWKYSSKRAAARIEFGVTQKDGRAAYFVSDNGAGFDMTHAGKLFGAFQRLHAPAEFQGTGIGLATVARIVRRHGGGVWAEGRVGEGATFYFSLGLRQEIESEQAMFRSIPGSEPTHAASARTPGELH